MDVLEEQLAIIHDGHWGDDDTYTFHGDHYTVEKLSAYPKPIQRPHPPLILGGDAGPRAARLAARYGDEYNTVMPTLEQAAERKARIDAACAAAGRDPIPFSIMGPLPGAPGDDAIEQLRALGEVGVARVYVQHLAHRDLDTVAWIGRTLAPALAGA
jgi:hypothetical protein